MPDTKKTPETLPLENFTDSQLAGLLANSHVNSQRLLDRLQTMIVSSTLDDGQQDLVKQIRQQFILDCFLENVLIMKLAGHFKSLKKIAEEAQTIQAVIEKSFPLIRKTDIRDRVISLKGTLLVSVEKLEELEIIPFIKEVIEANQIFYHFTPELSPDDLWNHIKKYDLKKVWEDTLKRLVLLGVDNRPKTPTNNPNKLSPEPVLDRLSNRVKRNDQVSIGLASPIMRSPTTDRRKPIRQVSAPIGLAASSEEYQQVSYDLDVARAQVKEQYNEIQKLQQELLQKQTQVKRLDDEYAENKAELIVQDEQIEQLKEELRKERDRLSTINISNSREKGTLSKSIEMLRADLEKAHKNKGELQKRIETLSHERDQWKKVHQDLKEEFEDEKISHRALRQTTNRLDELLAPHGREDEHMDYSAEVKKLIQNRNQANQEKNEFVVEANASLESLQEALEMIKSQYNAQKLTLEELKRAKEINDRERQITLAATFLDSQDWSVGVEKDSVNSHNVHLVLTEILNKISSCTQEIELLKNSDQTTRENINNLLPNVASLINNFEQKWSNSKLCSENVRNFMLADIDNFRRQLSKLTQKNKKTSNIVSDPFKIPRKSRISNRDSWQSSVSSDSHQSGSSDFSYSSVDTDITIPDQEKNTSNTDDVYLVAELAVDMQKKLLQMESFFNDVSVRVNTIEFRISSVIADIVKLASTIDSHHSREIKQLQTNTECLDERVIVLENKRKVDQLKQGGEYLLRYFSHFLSRDLAEKAITAFSNSCVKFADTDIDEESKKDLRGLFERLKGGLTLPAKTTSPEEICIAAPWRTIDLEGRDSAYINFNLFEQVQREFEWGNNRLTMTPTTSHVTQQVKLDLYRKTTHNTFQYIKTGFFPPVEDKEASILELLHLVIARAQKDPTLKVTVDGDAQYAKQFMDYLEAVKEIMHLSLNVCINNTNYKTDTTQKQKVMTAIQQRTMLDIVGKGSYHAPSFVSAC